MYLSIFTDELGCDITKGLPILRDWGLTHVDLRGRVLGRAAENLGVDELKSLRRLLDEHGMTVGCLQSSLAKVHLPDGDRCRAEAEKLERIIAAAEILDCRLVRSFFFWQPGADLRGALAVRPDEQQKVLDRFGALVERACDAGLVLGFENCGVTHDEVLAMVDAFDVPHWGLAWDVHNTWDCDERRRDAAAFVRRLAPHAKMVHVKAKGAVPGLAAEAIPYDTVLEMLHNAGLQGPVSVETHNPDAAVSNVDMSRRIVDVLRQAWPSAAPGGLDAPTSTPAEVTRPWADNPVRFAVIGLGMGHNRARMITQTPGTELVGVCDLVEERARRTAAACDVPWTLDMNELFNNDEVEVIYVLTETGRHGEVALQALDANKHVITTKPMDATLAACDAMVARATARGRLLAVDFGRRFNRDLHILRNAVSAGCFGRVLSGSAELKILRTMDYFRSNGGWRGTRRLDGGGVLSNQSIHHIDEIAFVLGIPDRVKCSIWTQNHDIEAEDLGTAVWLYGSGTVITFTATTSYPHSTWYHRLELTGTEGAYFRAGGGPFDSPVERWFRDGAWSDKAPVDAQPEWLNAADNMAAALRTGAELTCDGEDGRRTQSILDAMYRSAYDADGQWVEVTS